MSLLIFSCERLGRLVDHPPAAFVLFPRHIRIYDGAGEGGTPEGEREGSPRREGVHEYIGGEYAAAVHPRVAAGHPASVSASARAADVFLVAYPFTNSLAFLGRPFSEVREGGNCCGTRVTLPSFVTGLDSGGSGSVSD